MKDVNKIKRIIKNNYFIKDRVIKLEKAGFCIPYGECAMGSGGVGQIKFFPKLGVTRIQVGYAHGKHNYCVVAELKG